MHCSPFAVGFTSHIECYVSREGSRVSMQVFETLGLYGSFFPDTYIRLGWAPKLLSLQCSEIAELLHRSPGSTCRQSACPSSALLHPSSSLRKNDPALPGLQSLKMVISQVWLSFLFVTGWECWMLLWFRCFSQWETFPPEGQRGPPKTLDAKDAYTAQKSSQDSSIVKALPPKYKNSKESLGTGAGSQGVPER